MAVFKIKSSLRDKPYKTRAVQEWELHGPDAYPDSEVSGDENGNYSAGNITNLFGRGCGTYASDRPLAVLQHLGSDHPRPQQRLRRNSQLQQFWKTDFVQVPSFNESWFSPVVGVEANGKVEVEVMYVGWHGAARSQNFRYGRAQRLHSNFTTFRMGPPYVNSKIFRMHHGLFDQY